MIGYKTSASEEWNSAIVLGRDGQYTTGEGEGGGGLKKNSIMGMIEMET